MYSNSLFNKRVLITAGPTREALGPDRFISNYSSGKMGYAIAEAFLQQGAEVVLISGPVCISLQHPNLTVVNVNAAREMYLACCPYFESADIAFFTAAIADYNIDIAFEFGKIKAADQLAIGFALETKDKIKHAREKLEKKNFDMLILNSMSDTHATFGYDTNKISLYRKDGICKDFLLKAKTEMAVDIVFEVADILSHKISQSILTGSDLYDYSY